LPPHGHATVSVQADRPRGLRGLAHRAPRGARDRGVLLSGKLQQGHKRLCKESQKMKRLKKTTKRGKIRKSNCAVRNPVFPPVKKDMLEMVLSNGGNAVPPNASVENADSVEKASKLHLK
jgi:hypothetical protein